MNDKSVQDWISTENLEPFLAVVASMVGYKLYREDYDWVGIQYGLRDTDVEQDRWYAYPFEGRHPLLLELAYEPGAGHMVNVRVTSPIGLTAELTAQLDLLISVCQDYLLTHRH